jgi:hypothetical protein
VIFNHGAADSSSYDSFFSLRHAASNGLTLIVIVAGNSPLVVLL